MKYEIKFNKKLYKLKAIQLAINSYKHLAKFQIEDTKNYHIVSMSPFKNIKETNLKDEFINYVLANNR